MTRDEAIKILKTERYCQEDTPILKQVRKAYDMAIEALKREAHDGCDGCMYEHYEEQTEPCTSCKQNYTDRYIPEPKHDIDWIVGCIKHDGFIKTDRGDKANQIILEALEADTVEVVRCKDCKWYSNRHLCIQMSKFGSIEPLADFFCAFGERNEE